MGKVDLFEKIFGCIAASQIGSAMGVAVEGQSIEQIKNKYGVLDNLLPWGNYPAGTTEDGIERQRLMCTAIIEKGGRITAEDLAKIWIRDINPESFGRLMLWEDKIFYDQVKSGIPAGDVGRYSNWPGLVAFPRSCHPIGIINACNPEQAVLDAFDVGRLYQPLNGYGLDWSGVVAAAIAEALKPNATVDSVINTAVMNVPEYGVKRWRVADPVQKEILDGIERAKLYNDVFEMRPAFYERYHDSLDTWPWVWNMSMAYEIVTKGLAIFYVTKGDPVKSIIGAVNFGRDTDCLAAVAGGISGAFSGIGDIPLEWIETVDKATKENKLTVSKRRLKETAVGLYDAVIKNAEKLEKQIQYIKMQG